MITKEQAMALRHGQELHFGVCKSTTGPRGGVKVTQVRVRVSGQCQTWKTRPEDFRVPVKHGLYSNGEIVPSNAAQFHLTDNCPLNVKASTLQEHCLWTGNLREEPQS
jgi:hypothetical protein